MTVRTVTLGGTDWSDGEVLYAADLNDTVEETMYLTSLFSKDTDTSIPLVDFTLTTGTTTLNRGYIHKFKSFTMSGGTINVDTDTDNYGKPLIILVDGAVSFTGGTIDVSDSGFVGGASVSISETDGNDGESFEIEYNSIGGGAGGAGGAGSSGSAGSAGTISTFTYFVSADQPSIINYNNILVGTGGGSGGTRGAVASGKGGTGGGGIIFISTGDFNFGASAIIDVSGEDGDAGSNDGSNAAAGGGGGGSGGMVVIGCKGTLTDSGTATVTGGAGGAGGSGAGGAYGGGGGAGGSHYSSGSNGVAGTINDGGDGGAGGAGLKVTFSW